MLKKSDWTEIKKAIESTKNLDVDNVLIVPLRDWNPAILTPKRKELFLVIREKHPESETALTKIVHRKRENVVSDLKILEHYGLIERKRKGKCVIPVATKTQIMLL